MTTNNTEWEPCDQEHWCSYISRGLRHDFVSFLFTWFKKRTHVREVLSFRPSVCQLPFYNSKITIWSSTRFVFGAYTPSAHYTFHSDSCLFSTISPVAMKLKWNIIKLLRKYSDHTEIDRLYRYRLHAFLQRLFEMFSRIIPIYGIRFKNTFYVEWGVVYLCNRMACLWIVRGWAIDVEFLFRLQLEKMQVCRKQRKLL